MDSLTSDPASLETEELVNQLNTYLPMYTELYAALEHAFQEYANDPVTHPFAETVAPLLIQFRTMTGRIQAWFIELRRRNCLEILELERFITWLQERGMWENFWLHWAHMGGRLEDLHPRDVIQERRERVGHLTIGIQLCILLMAQVENGLVLHGL